MLGEQASISGGEPLSGTGRVFIPTGHRTEKALEVLADLA
jgi:hypothetical protein